MAEPFLLYHWAPTSRRKSILNMGLCPGKKSRCGLWKPPYVCFTKSPSLSWGSSADMGITGKVEDFDLWMVWSNCLGGYELLPEYKGGMREYRVYHRIKKSLIWYVGTRTFKPRATTG